jgi:hypothetical protein
MGIMTKGNGRVVFGSSNSIVTDGLVFYVDAANTKSYVSGSTTTNSLVGNITGSLINDIGFSTENQGTWDFDGTDDRLEINDLVDIPLANSSFNIWVRPNQGLGEGRAYQWCFTADATYPVMGLAYTPTDKLGLPTAPGSYDIISGNQGTNRFRLNTTGSTFQKEWTNVCVTKESGGNTGNNHNSKIYVNGVNQDLILLDDTATQDWWLDNLSLTRFNLGVLYRPSSNSVFSDTNISSFSIYNRALTPTEVLQNYNALKGRFGL